jgi:hypothetical protein
MDQVVHRSKLLFHAKNRAKRAQAEAKVEVKVYLSKKRCTSSSLSKATIITEKK